MGTIDLRAGPTVLRLVTDERAWCGVTLLGEPSRYLGAELFGVLQRELCTTLQNRHALAYFDHIEGTPVAWVLALAEEHTSIYASKDAAFLVLFLQDKDAQIIARLTLTEAECESWIDVLCSKPKGSENDREE